MSRSKMKFLKIISVFLIVLGVHCNRADAYAAIPGTFSSFSSIYKYSGMQNCPEMNIGDACVGDSWESGPGVCDHMVGNGTESDEGAVLIFIAKQVKNTGAKFCLTQVQGENKDEQSPWLGYYNPSGNQFKCFWLCMPGYGGSECDEPAESAAEKLCDSQEITREAFQDYRLATNNNAPSLDSSWKLESWYNGCSGNGHTNQQHDAFIGISGWLPGGHGAKVSSMIAWSDRYGWDPMTSDAKITTAGESIIMCAPGYKPNANNTDCVAINYKMCCDVADIECIQSNANFCNGFLPEKYNPSEHNLDATGNGNCLRYFCKDSSQAFPALGDVSCMDCATGIKGGPSKDDGVCIKCATGQYFDSEANECKTARGFSKRVLQYGPSESKAANVNEECWTITDPDTYKQCVGIKPFTVTEQVLQAMTNKIDLREFKAGGKDQISITLPSGLNVYSNTKKKLQKQ